MEQYIGMAVDLVSSADVWLISISAVLVALAGVAKLTKTKKDDELVAKAKGYLDKALALVKKVKPTAKKAK